MSEAANKQKVSITALCIAVSIAFMIGIALSDALVASQWRSYAEGWKKLAMDYKGLLATKCLAPAMEPNHTSLSPHQDVVDELKKNWGSRAEVYSNETGVALISTEGYVSEFDAKTGVTKHTGILPAPK